MGARTVMHILVISDTHGHLENVREVLKKDGPFDMILHLGDVCRDEDELRDMAGERCTVSIVRGNCDIFSREPDQRDFKIGKYNIHMEHGQYLPYSLQSISYKAEEIGADIIFFGHTHSPLLTWQGNVRIVNPGSISKPRQADGNPTYLLMDVDAEGEISFTPGHL